MKPIRLIAVVALFAAATPAWADPPAGFVGGGRFCAAVHQMRTVHEGLPNEYHNARGFGNGP